MRECMFVCNKVVDVEEVGNQDQARSVEKEIGLCS